MAKALSATELDHVDLIEKLSDAKQELFNLRFQIATGQLDNSCRLNEVKKEIARYLTELRAREIAEAEDRILDGGEED